MCFRRRYLQLYLKAEQFEEGRKVRPWLYTIATNQAIDAQRRNRRHKMVSLDRRGHSQEGQDSVGSLLDLLTSKEPGATDNLETDERRQWFSKQLPIYPIRCGKRFAGVLPGTEIPRGGHRFEYSSRYRQKPHARGDFKIE